MSFFLIFRFCCSHYFLSNLLLLTVALKMTSLPPVLVHFSVTPPVSFSLKKTKNKKSPSKPPQNALEDIFPFISYKICGNEDPLPSYLISCHILTCQYANHLITCWLPIIIFFIICLFFVFLWYD